MVFSSFIHRISRLNHSVVLLAGPFYFSKINQKGFMLIELIIVLVLILLILGMSTVFFANTLPSSKFNALVREISANIKYAITTAKLRGEDQAFYIDFESRQYGIEGLKSKDFPANINIRVFNSLGIEISRGRYQIMIPATGGVESGTILLSDGKRIATIHLDPVVGTITIK